MDFKETEYHGVNWLRVLSKGVKGKVVPVID
jgi:hypothetical protein